MDMNKLPEEVAEKYTVKKGRPFKFVHRTLGRIDLNKASLKLVEALISAGVTHIIAKKIKDK